jgi:pilus assembly protein CpaE
MAIFYADDVRTAGVLVRTIGGAVAGDVTVVDNAPQLARALGRPGELLLVIGPGIDLVEALSITRTQLVARPALGVVLLRDRVDITMLTDALRAGVRDVVHPNELTAVSDACTRSLAASRRSAGGGIGRTGRALVVTVFAAKDGVGKTTVATNLAAAFAAAGRRTCLLDLDLAYGDVAAVLQLPADRSIADAPEHVDDVDAEAIGSLLTMYRTNLAALLAPAEPGLAQRIRPATVRRVLEVLMSTMGVVVVDTPAAFTEHVLIALEASDFHVLVATPDLAALKNLRLALDTLDQLGYPQEVRRLLLNRADEKAGLSTADVECALGASLDGRLPASRAFSAAMNRGVPLVLDQPRHEASKALRHFAVDKILNRTLTISRRP